MTSNKCISDMTNADSGKIAQSVAKFDDENEVLLLFGDEASRKNLEEC